MHHGESTAESPQRTATTETTLLVFAHRDEASAFSDVPHLVTGVGKVNAAVSLAGELASRGGSVSRVVVLGTAGVVDDGPDLDTVYQIGAVKQHDFSLPSPTIEPRGPVFAPRLTVATGDVFVQDDAQRTRIAGLGAELVDMESYAIAALCARFDLELVILKVPSDCADSSTTDEEWDTIVFRKSEQLRAFAEAELPELFA